MIFMCLSRINSHLKRNHAYIRVLPLIQEELRQEHICLLLAGYLTWAEIDAEYRPG